METRTHHVYIMASGSRRLYIGMTGDLPRRVTEHRLKLIPGFTSKYNMIRLVYFEAHHDRHAAVARERELKGWVRSKKLALIQSQNPEWNDLAETPGVDLD